MEGEKTEQPVVEQPAAATAEETKPFPQIPEGIPAEHRESFAKFLQQEAKARTEQANKLGEYIKVAESQGLEAYHLRPLADPSIQDPSVRNAAEQVLNLITSNLKDMEKKIQPAAATPAQTTNNSKPVTITDPSKSATVSHQQQQQQPPAKKQKQETELWDRLYAHNYKMHNK